MRTIVAIVTLVPEEGNVKVRAQVVTPDERVEHFYLYDHDWSYDWSKTRAPASLFRALVQRGFGHPHGDRKVYESPRLSEDGPNSAGMVTVYEIDYDG